MEKEESEDAEQDSQTEIAGMCVVLYIMDFFSHFSFCSFLEIRSCYLQNKMFKHFHGQLFPR